MGRAIVIGLLSTFLVLLCAITWETSRLIVSNWRRFRDWRAQDRASLEDMALWVGMPLMKIGMLYFSADALLSLLQGHAVTSRMAARGLIALPFLMTASGLMLWLVFSTRYGPARGDKRWWCLMWGSVALGAAMFVASGWL